MLLETKDGRKACMAAITALDKARGLKAFEFKSGLKNVAIDTAEDIAKNNATGTTLPLVSLIQKYANIKSTAKEEFNADRIILFGVDLYTAKNIVCALLINDGVPDAKARNVLLSNQYCYVGCAVRKHPTQDYVVVLSVCTPVYEDK